MTTFFKRIFGLKNRAEFSEKSNISQPEWTAKRPDFVLESLRFLVIRESIHGHKSVIFDSAGTQRFCPPFNESETFEYIHENEFGYKIQRESGHAEEIKNFADHMLGTIPLAGQSNALKVHFLNSSQTLWSLTFLHEVVHKSHNSSYPSSLASSFGSRIGDSAQDFYLESDSGFFSPKPSMSFFSETLSDLSLQRRWQLSNSSLEKSESFLQIPSEARQRSKSVKISVGLLLDIPAILQLESSPFLEELLQRLKIQISNYISKGERIFLHQMFCLYCQTKEVIWTYMRTKRLHLTAWHLKTHNEFLAKEFYSLRKSLDTKEKKFFLCTWLTAFLVHNPTWAYSMVPEAEIIPENQEISVRQMMQMSGKNFYYNVGETQKTDLCGGRNQISKFLLTSHEEHGHWLESLIFVTTYFLRTSVVRRRKISACPKITDEFLKARKVTLKSKRNAEIEAESSNDGVLFLLGENEKLVQNPKNVKKRDSRGSLSYMKVNMSTFPTAYNTADHDDICPLPYGISISNQVLPGEALQGCILKESITVKQIEDILEKDVRFHQGPKEFMWIHGNIENGQTDVYSSNMPEKCEVVFAPLVADLVDIFEESQANHEYVLDQVEDSLLKIYLVSKLMVALIRNPNQILSLETMAKFLGVDRNDIPLLVAVAATHTPDLQLKLSLMNK